MPFIDECVITASKYCDFLRVTLPFTLNHVGKVVVVTSDKSYDDPIRDLCRFYGVDCLTTGLFHYKDAPFAKGKAINRGLDLLSKEGWILHMDADIVLPAQTTRVLNRLNLDPMCIYGIDRVNCPNAPAFKRYLDAKQPQYKYTCLVETPGEFPLMARWIHPTDGYCPIGYFQLWNTAAIKGPFHLRYPEDANNAIRNDVQHALQWDGTHRRLIPDLIAIHLDSCNAPIGANWEGRTTPTFDLNAEKAPVSSGVKSFYDPSHPRFQKPNAIGSSY